MRAKLVENIEFKRGQSSKKALDIGYVRNMGENAEKLSYYLNMGSDIQYSLELSNHPSTVNTMRNMNNPVYVISGGMEGGYGLHQNDDRIVYFNIYIDPLELIIWGELSLTHFNNSDDEIGEMEDEDYKTEKISISSDDIHIMAIGVKTITQELFKKANIEIE